MELENDGRVDNGGGASAACNASPTASLSAATEAITSLPTGIRRTVKQRRAHRSGNNDNNSHNSSGRPSRYPRSFPSSPSLGNSGGPFAAPLTSYGNSAYASAVEFNPRLILGQIVALQCFHYASMGLLVQLNHGLFGTSVTIDRIFTDRYLRWFRSSVSAASGSEDGGAGGIPWEGWADGGAVIVNSLVV